jgi:hypothetical protein
MNRTPWELRKALSDQLRAVWDAKRDGMEWEKAFVAARSSMVRAHQRDARILLSMSWDEFKRLQGWRDDAEKVSEVRP